MVMEKPTTLVQLCEAIDRNASLHQMMKYCPYAVLKNISIGRYPAGSVLLSRGERCSRFYIVVSGRLAIGAVSREGKEFTLSTYQSGMYFGELEILEDKPCVSSVRAISAVKLLEVARADYLRWLELDGNFSRYVLSTLCASMYGLSEKATSHTLLRLKERLCRYLADHAAPGEDGISVAVTAKALADVMGVTARSVSRILKELKEEEIIEPCNRRILIKNLGDLRRAGE